MNLFFILFLFLLISPSTMADNFGYLRVFDKNVSLNRPYHIYPSSDGGIRFNAVDYVDSFGFFMFRVDDVSRKHFCPIKGREISPGVFSEDRFDERSNIGMTYICSETVGIMVGKDDPFLKDLMDALIKK